MIFGAAVFIMGYAVFYWGLHHLSWYKSSRYSLWCLLGIGSLWKTVNLNAENIAGMKKSGVDFGTQTQNPNNSRTPNYLTGGFVSPLSATLKQGRTDQGVDFSGYGDLYAIGSGTILSVYNPGWPGLHTFIVLKLDNPQGLPSPDIYYAEDIQPTVRVGQHVNAGDTIGTATGGSTGIEIGFADPNAIGRALGWQFGGQFKQFLSKLSPLQGPGSTGQ